MPVLSETEVIHCYQALYQQNPRATSRQHRISHHLANLAGFNHYHAQIPNSHSQGLLQCLYELQQHLLKTTGAAALTFSIDSWQRDHPNTEFSRFDIATAYGRVSVWTAQQASSLSMIEYDGDSYTAPALYANIAGLLCAYVDGLITD